MQEKQREEKIKRWFDMWLTGERQELSRLFDKNVYYSESWGPEYHGIAQLEHWFDDWTQQGKVEQWKIQAFYHQNQNTVVEWNFRCTFAGKVQQFDGVTIVEKIFSLREFGSVSAHTLPYGV